MRRYTIFQNVLEKLSILIVLATIVWVTVCYGRLPDVIPTHFDFRGNVTGTGGKGMIWLTLALDVFCTLCMLIPGRFLPINSRTVHLNIRIPDEAWPLLAPLTVSLLLWCAFFCSLLFAIPNIELIYGKSEPISAGVIVTILVAVCAYYTRRLRYACR